MTPLIGRPGTRHRVPRVPGWLRYRAYHTATGCTIKRMFGGKADGPNGGIPLFVPQARSFVEWLAQPKLHEEGGKPDGSEGWRPRRETPGNGVARSARIPVRRRSVA